MEPLDDAARDSRRCCVRLGAGKGDSGQKDADNVLAEEVPGTNVEVCVRERERERGGRERDRKRESERACRAIPHSWSPIPHSWSPIPHSWSRSHAHSWTRSGTRCRA